ncbi:dienelactone hydrolase [Kitasatospora sp. MAP12-15]|uniref:acyl-CoA thioester hydrolase/BAAT C-terminal domain-containing protein n=1 Tax=unclassified Kitasatospora TaxID=2633591 RepID=UPI002473ED89|nr:acyl-CoA thioester hydrolase/BAAT C-terminal domain-containing protein [Kitasatospora sp. MAP12-44]MDH6108505.1 dienelactone hydrolase [Kitasatospora sp. MAP12-44]
MKVIEQELVTPWEAVLLEPVGGSRTGVLVLSGSSGRVERQRARVLAEQGCLALAIRWFGGAGQAAGICEVPLETFVAAVDLLRARGAERICILGTSKGAEAALLTAVRDPRVDVVVALAPTSVVWGNVGPGLDGEQRPYRSSWSWRGQPLPFVPYDDSWLSADHGDGPVAIRGCYEQSERTFAADLDAAAIPVEQARADILLVAGADDEMWPALRYARELAARREAVGAQVEVITRDDAGHRPRLPGEGPAAPSTVYHYGGTAEGDALLGEAAWGSILDRLG